MEESILTNTKKLVGLTEEDTSFDVDIIVHINSAFTTLNDLGIGPPQGFGISDSVPEWATFSGDLLMLNMIKAYVYFKVRLGFDPPQAPPAIAAMEKQVAELEWRMNVRFENYGWVDPRPIASLEDGDDVILDGGAP